MDLHPHLVSFPLVLYRSGCPTTAFRVLDPTSQAVLIALATSYIQHCSLYLPTGLLPYECQFHAATIMAHTLAIFRSLGFWLLVATASAQAPQDPLKDLCRRYGHQTTVIDRSLYIDGGWVYADPLEQNPIPTMSTCATVYWIR